MSTDSTQPNKAAGGEQAWTVGRLLNWTAEYLGKQGAMSPRLDAEVLLAHVRRCERIMLYAAFDEEADEPTRVAFRELVRRRAEGTPVAYLVGAKEFYSLSFEVTPEVLIPRPETEFLVVTALDLAKEIPAPADGPLTIADVGTGSGAVAVCLARGLPKARVVATDISPEALQVARRNAARHGVEERIELLQSDLLAELPEQQAFHVIASNPPYISREEMAELPRDVADYEPHLALNGGQRDGAEISLRLIAEAIPRLHGGGALVLETSPMLAKRLQQHLNEHPEMTSAEVTQDLAGLARIVAARKRR